MKRVLIIFIRVEEFCCQNITLYLYSMYSSSFFFHRQLPVPWENCFKPLYTLTDIGTSLQRLVPAALYSCRKTVFAFIYVLQLLIFQAEEGEVAIFQMSVVLSHMSLLSTSTANLNVQ
jgi:hypothetical protein